MSIPQILALSFQTSAPQAKIITGGNVQLLGSTFSSGQTYAAEHCAQARIVQFNGALYAFVQSGVFRSTNYGQSWSSIYSPPSIVANSGIKQIYVIQLAGVATLCIAYESTDIANWTVRLAKSTDGITWTASGTYYTVYNGAATAYVNADFIYKGSVYSFGDYSGAADFYYYAVYDFTNLTATRSAISFNTIFSLTSMMQPEFVEFNGSLFTIIGSGSAASATIHLIRINGTAWSQVGSLNTPLTSSSSYQERTARSGLFTDGTNIYTLLYYQGGAGADTTGFRCVQFNSSFVGTDITTTVVPDTMRGGTNVIPSTARVRTLVDCVSDPASPQIYIWYCPNGGGGSSIFTPWSIYRWVNNTTQFEFVDTGASYQDAIPFTKLTEGSTFYTTDNNSYSNHVEILSRATTNNGTAIRLTFKLYSASGTQLVDMTGYYGTNADEFADNVATLSAPSSGSLVGNTVENLVADNGVTTYGVTWESNADGFGSGDPYKFVFRTVPA